MGRPAETEHYGPIQPSRLPPASASVVDRIVQFRRWINRERGLIEIIVNGRVIDSEPIDGRKRTRERLR